MVHQRRCSWCTGRAHLSTTLRALTMRPIVTCVLCTILLLMNSQVLAPQERSGPMVPTCRNAQQCRSDRGGCRAVVERVDDGAGTGV